jgi:SAM-dependent methyltransferase
MSQTVQGQESYASLRARREPNALLVQAVGLLPVRNGRALDIGAGPLNDSLFLLRAGLSVDAVDSDPHTLSLASELSNPRLNVVRADIRDVRIVPDAFSLVVAIHVLPFLPRADLLRTLPAIIEGLSEGGILCCTFLGPDDSWAQRRPHMTFLSRSEVSGLLSQLQPVVFSEQKYQGANAKDEPKRWHVFRGIFRK